MSSHIPLELELAIVIEGHHIDMATSGSDLLRDNLLTGRKLGAPGLSFVSVELANEANIKI